MINKQFIIKIVNDYLEDKKSLNDLEKIASDILILDDAPEIDPNSEEMLTEFLNYLEDLDTPWNSNVGKNDIKFYRDILISVDNQNLAIKLLYILRYRQEYEKILNDYKDGNIDEIIVEKMISDWNYPIARELFKRIFLKIKNNKDKISSVFKAYKNGQIEYFIDLIKG